MDSTGSSLRWSYSTLGDKICAMCIPVIGIIESMVLSLVACFEHHRQPPKLRYTFDDFVRIASNSIFSVNEVEALLELFRKLSIAIIDDCFIRKEELQLMLLRAPSRQNLFLDRAFDLFEEKKNGVIEFEEFVHALSVFHPYASLEDKIDFAFRLYDLRQTGYIEREGVSLFHAGCSIILLWVTDNHLQLKVKQLINAILLESGTSPENLNAIIDKTFADADADKDGKIDKEEWKAFVVQHPALLKNMTLPYLKDITTVIPSLIFNTEDDD